MGYSEHVPADGPRACQGSLRAIQGAAYVVGAAARAPLQAGTEPPRRQPLQLRGQQVAPGPAPPPTPNTSPGLNMIGSTPRRSSEGSEHGLPSAASTTPPSSSELRPIADRCCRPSSLSSRLQPRSGDYLGFTSGCSCAGSCRVPHRERSWGHRQCNIIERARCSWRRIGNQGVVVGGCV